jgi:hypothetical protein
MPCGCGKTGQTARVVESARPAPAAEGAVIAAAHAGRWRLRTASGTVYAYDTLADARTAQMQYGGRVDRDW